MIEAQALLDEKFFHLLLWERVKRRERVLIEALTYSLLASLLLVPAGGLVRGWLGPLALPLLVFPALVLGFSLSRRWKNRESTRAVSLLDKNLGQQERALTAWEILGREEKSPAELLVLEEAAAGLRPVDTRSYFKREWSWHAFLAPPLLLVWMFLAWLDYSHHFDPFDGSPVASVARRLKEFSQGLKEKAAADDLTKSAEMARAIEEVAEQGLRGEIGVEKLRSDLTSVVNRMTSSSAASADGPAISLPPLSSTALSELKAELGKLRDALAGDQLRRELRGSEALQRLAAQSLFGADLERALSSIEDLDREEIRGLLDRLERDVAAALDRSTLQDSRQFLLSLLEGTEGGEAAGSLQGSAQAGSGGSRANSKDRARGGLPGDQPGTKAQRGQAPLFQARATAHLKGLLGKGPSAGLTFRGEAQGRESEVAAEEIVASYERHVEEELASERIPVELKQNVKRYFLSLGVTRGRVGEE